MKTEMAGKPETEKLLGKYFRSANEDNKIEWQGVVIGEPHPGWYLVQLLEWTSGEPSVQTSANRENDRLVVLSRRGHDDVWVTTSTITADRARLSPLPPCKRLNLSVWRCGSF
jgi:hypothetical protein